MAPSRRQLRAQELASVLAKTRSECAYCGVDLRYDPEIAEYIPYQPWHVDHCIPLSRGGTDTLDNLLPSCAECNRRKGARTIEEFREHEHKRLLEMTARANGDVFDSPYIDKQWDRIQEAMSCIYNAMKQTPIVFHFEHLANGTRERRHER